MSQEGIAHLLEDERSHDSLLGERLIPLLDTPSGGGPPPGSGPFCFSSAGHQRNVYQRILAHSIPERGAESTIAENCVFALRLIPASWEHAGTLGPACGKRRDQWASNVAKKRSRSYSMIIQVPEPGMRRAPHSPCSRYTSTSSQTPIVGSMAQQAASRSWMAFPAGLRWRYCSMPCQI